MSLSVDTHVPASTVRLRGLDVVIEMKVDAAECERRQTQSLHLYGMETTTLGALLKIPALQSTPVATLPADAQDLVRRRPRLVEFLDGDRVRRRLSPVAQVDMVTLPTARWRRALHDVGRFAPYSARRLLLHTEPADLDLLCMEATYWGVGICLQRPGGCYDIVHPAPFAPARFTGASWAFAEQALRAVQRAGINPWPPASA